MNDYLLFGAGGLGVLVALVHGHIGRTRLLPPLTGVPGVPGVPDVHGRVLGAVFQLSTLYWIAGGLILMAVPLLPDHLPRPFAVYAVAFLFVSGAVGNFWATRGRHIGWVLLGFSSTMAVLGA